MMNNLEILILVSFVSKILNLIELEIIVIWLVNREDQLITHIVLISNRNKVIFYRLYFIIPVIMTVIYWLKI